MKVIQSSVSGYSIGGLAIEAGISVETVRFYERKGLIPKPDKRIGSSRRYSQVDLVKILFIKRLQALGFTLREACDLLELNTSATATCGQIRAHTQIKLEEIERKLADLRAVQKTLKKLVAACGNGKKAAMACRVMNCFEMKCDC